MERVFFSSTFYTGQREGGMEIRESVTERQREEHIET